MAIRGSRACVFPANAIAILIWRKRLIAFLKTEQRDAEIKKDKDGGKTRRYLIEMLDEQAVVASLCAMGLVYLMLYLPFCAALEHLEKIVPDLPNLDQSVYYSLLSSTENISDILGGGEEESSGILASEYDQVGKRNLRLRNRLRQEIASLDGQTAALVREMLQAMLEEGAGAFHHYTVEWQIEQHKDVEEKALALNITDIARRNVKLCAGRSRTQRQERMFGTAREVHDRAPSLLRHHLSGQTRGRLERPSHFIFGLCRSGYLSWPQVEAIMLFVAKEARTRSRLAGGRRGEYLAHGLKKIELQAAAVAEAARKAEKRETELNRLRALRVASLKALDGLSDANLRDQIKAFKYVDGIDVTLSEFSSKLSRLEALYELFCAHMPPEACNASPEEIAAMAGRRPSRERAARRPTASSSKATVDNDKEYEVEMIVGAKMTPDGRMYCVRWTDANPEEPLQPWETWVYYGAIFTEGGVSEELAMQIEQVDIVTPEEDVRLTSASIT